MKKKSHKLFKKEPKLVAELCCNHQGDLKIAKKMIFEAKKAGADYTKFQKWNPSVALTKEEYNTNHPFSYNSFAKQCCANPYIICTAFNSFFKIIAHTHA